MIAILAHALSIVLLIPVTAVGDQLSVFGVKLNFACLAVHLLNLRTVGCIKYFNSNLYNE